VEEPRNGKDKSHDRNGRAEHGSAEQHSVGECGLRLIGWGIAEIARVVFEVLDGSRHRRSSASTTSNVRVVMLLIHLCVHS
jgi:hypothetical protein